MVDIFTIEDVKNNKDNYVIKNGNVYLRDSGEQVLDEDKIAMIKSTALVYYTARENYQSDIAQFGNSNVDFTRYVNGAMERLGVNGQVNNYGTNKLIRAILNSDGHLVEQQLAESIVGTKYDLLIDPKKDFTMAYLKLKFREKGMDIDDLTVGTAFDRKTGIGTVTIDFKLNKYVKRDAPMEEMTREQNVNQQQTHFVHPQADLLNELERQKKEARENNDEVAYNYAQANIERIVRQNPVEVTPEQWDTMGIDERKSFMAIKMKEAKTLKDEVSFNFWKANLAMLDEKAKNVTLKTGNADTDTGDDGNRTVTYIEPSYQATPNINVSMPIPQQEDEKEVSLYNKMMAAIKRSRMPNLTDEEKQQIVGEIHYYEGFLVNSIQTEQEMANILGAAAQDFSASPFEQSIFNTLLSDLGERLNAINPKVNAVNNQGNGLSQNIASLRTEMGLISGEYEKMKDDGRIDDQELDYLITRMQDLYRSARAIDTGGLTREEQQILAEIIAAISKQRNKMTILRDDMEKSVQAFGR